MKKGCILYNTEKELAKKIYNKALVYFKNKNVEILPLEEVNSVDFVLVIGGDGTLLRGFKKFITNDKIFVIAVNAGNLGFLTEIKQEAAFSVLDNFIEDKFRYEERHILEIIMGNKKYYALNEVCFSKSNAISKVLKIKFISNGEYMCTYKGDGVIICTPSGSTAYSMAAGGPIVESNIKVMIITPLAPHNLNTRPIVIDGNEEITVSLEDKDREGYMVVDGQIIKEISCKDTITVKYYSKKLKLVIPEDRSYYNVLREKLKWGDNLC